MSKSREREKAWRRQPWRPCVLRRGLRAQLVRAKQNIRSSCRPVPRADAKAYAEAHERWLTYLALLQWGFK